MTGPRPPFPGHQNEDLHAQGHACRLQAVEVLPLSASPANHMSPLSAQHGLVGLAYISGPRNAIAQMGHSARGRCKPGLGFSIAPASLLRLY